MSLEPEKKRHVPLKIPGYFLFETDKNMARIPKCPKGYGETLEFIK